MMLVISVGIGIVGIFTGRNADGTPKTAAQLAAQAALAEKK
jgi:hypothetical protein